MTTWFVFAIIAIIAFAGNSNLKSIPEGLQNLTDITEFIRDLAKTQIGEEEYVKWVPF
jgi:F-type H+-transporting ATPase subunit a